jgi:thiamine-monophosphate kinase
MSLKQRLDEDVKAAMRARDRDRLGTLRLITAAIKQREVDERIVLDDAQVLAVLDKMVKQRRESIAQFDAAGRADLADKERFELGILQEFLPAALTPAATALVGGDTTRGPLTVTVQIIGSLPAGSALTRAGAQPGDLVHVSGTLGDAAAGLAAWPPPPSPSGALEHVLARFSRPTPRLALGEALRGIASSCIDVSDGLLADVGHLAAGSGCAMELDAARLPLSAALRERCDPPTALRHALTGGDDYELCFTVPPSALPRLHALAGAGIPPLSCIGRVRAGAGVRALGGDGRVLEFARPGFDHFDGAD